MTTSPSERQAVSDKSDSNESVTVTITVTSRGQKYSGLTAGGDRSDSKKQGILSWKKKKKERRPGGNTSTAIVIPVMRRTLQITVTSVTRGHRARNILASGGDKIGDSNRYSLSPTRHSLSPMAGRVAA